jgi:hypothetical protein
LKYKLFYVLNYISNNFLRNLKWTQKPKHKESYISFWLIIAQKNCQICGHNYFLWLWFTGFLSKKVRNFHKSSDCDSFLFIWNFFFFGLHSNSFICRLFSQWLSRRGDDRLIYYIDMNCLNCLTFPLRKCQSICENLLWKNRDYCVFALHHIIPVQT